MTGIPISVAIITKNEEASLSTCLEGLKLAHEIVIVDSGSTDNTLAIAKQFKCRIFSEHWKGYGPQKQSAVDKCRNEWVLILDADEYINASTWTAIENAINTNAERADAFRFPRRNYYNGKWLKHGYEWPDKVVRLLNKSRCRLQDIIHEEVAAERILDIPTPIIHVKNYAMDNYLSKLNDYTSFLAKRDLEQNPGKKSGVRRAFFSFLAHFSRAYFLKLAFLDGKEGFIISFTEALHSFYKYIKILELQGKITVPRRTDSRPW